MSKADELLNRIMANLNDYEVDNAYVFTYLEDLSLIGQAYDYLNREDELVVGSEWVCDVDCYGILNGMMPLIIENGMEVIITSEDKNTFIQFEIDYCGTTSSFQIPYNQFLACFAPKENV